VAMRGAVAGSGRGERAYSSSASTVSKRASSSSVERVGVSIFIASNFLSPITTKPWGEAIPKLAEVPPPAKEMRDSELLYNEPKYVRLDDGGLRTLQDAGLKLKKGVYY